jgi:hypothetical protein
VKGIEMVYMLTTVDNPYNPFTHYDEWQAFDARLGYHTPSYLARIVLSSDSLSDADNEQAIDDAIIEICKINILGIYRKVTEQDADEFARAAVPISEGGGAA